MTQTRFSKDMPDHHIVANTRGLLLAACLKPLSVQLLLGPDATMEEAKRYQDEARGRLYVLKDRVARARAI